MLLSFFLVDFKIWYWLIYIKLVLLLSGCEREVIIKG